MRPAAFAPATQGINYRIFFIQTLLHTPIKTLPYKLSNKYGARHICPCNAGLYHTLRKEKLTATRPYHCPYFFV